MNFSTVAIVLGGLVLYNVGKNGGEWVATPQEKLELMRGNSGANINLNQVLTHWRPTTDPSFYQPTETYRKRVTARLSAQHPNDALRAVGKRQVVRNNYRVGSGAVGPSPSTLHKQA